MATIKQIVGFLEEIGHCSASSGGADLDTDIAGIATDAASEEGQLSWISPTQHARDPDRWKRFGGSLLIGPEELPMNEDVRFVSVSTAYPKLAFIRVVDRFFEILASVALPQVGEPAISPEAHIGRGVNIGVGAAIGPHSWIGDNVTIGCNTVLVHCQIGNNTTIGCNCSIGLPGFGYERDESGGFLRFPHLGRVVIGTDVEIGSNTCIDRGGLGDTLIGDGCKIDNLVHIAHNVRLGKNTMVIANSMVGGSTVIEDNVWIAPSVSILNQLAVGSDAVLGMGAVVLKNVEPGSVVVGNPGKPLPEKARGR